jgi:hypothetical protein
MHAGEVFTEHINGLIVTTPFDADKLRRQGHDVNLSKLSQVDPWPRKPLRRTEGPKTLNVKGRRSAKHTGSLRHKLPQQHNTKY